MTKKMTEGSPAKLIVMFTIPLLIGNIFQQLYSMVDTLIVGRTLGVNALAAVGCTGSINFLILGFAMGVSAGLAIITAQRFGAKDEKKRGLRSLDQPYGYGRADSGFRSYDQEDSGTAEYAARNN